MKKIKSITIIARLMFLFTFLIIGCEREGEVIPKYIGIWQSEYCGGHKKLLELNEKTFKWCCYRINQNGEEYLHVIINGDIIIDNDSIFFIDNQIFTDSSCVNETGLIEFNRGTEDFYKWFGERSIHSYRLAVGDDILVLYENEPSGIGVELLLGINIFNRVLK